MTNTDLMRQAGAALAMSAQKTTLTDQEALTVKNLQKEWKTGEEVEVGDRRQHKDLLYKCRQAHTTQDNWTPDQYQAGWEVIDEIHSGTKEDPIPYTSGMQVYNGKYYTEDGILYLCTRDSGQAIYNRLAELVGVYVQITE